MKYTINLFEAEWISNEQKIRNESRSFPQKKEKERWINQKEKWIHSFRCSAQQYLTLGWIML